MHEDGAFFGPAAAKGRLNRVRVLPDFHSVPRGGYHDTLNRLRKRPVLFCNPAFSRYAGHMAAPFHIAVPATMANLGPGFDTFGLAVGLYNRFTFRPADADALSVAPASSVETAALAVAPADSILFSAMAHFSRNTGLALPPLAVEIEAHIPVARGLGSSSTAIVAALLAANRLAGEPLTRQALLEMAIALEGHPDNVAPAMLGGAVMYDTRPYALPWPEAWKIAVVIPPYPVLTEEARKALPEKYPLADAVFTLRKASLLTYALLEGDEAAFRASLDDRLHQPYRETLIPDYRPVRELAMEAGAFGTIISGSGSTIGIYYPSSAEESLLTALRAYGEKCPGMVVKTLAPDLSGAVETQGATL